MTPEAVNENSAIQWAEIIDSLRVVPRILLFAYCGWAFHVIDKILVWYTHLTVEAQNIQNAGMVTAVITAVTGFGVPIFKIYSENGRNWNDKPQPNTATVTTATVERTTATTP